MKLKNINLIVIGDIMLDKWLHGDRKKSSAEAPIKVFNLKNKKYSLGGAGNLSRNLKNLKVKFKLFTEVGKDIDGKKVIGLLKKYKINYSILSEEKITTSKKRFFVNGKQIFREDKEDTKINKRITNQILKKINRNDIIIISDYAKGIVDKNFHSALIKKKCITLIDPKNRPEFYKGAYLIKPNLAKFEEWCGKFSKLKAFNLMKKMKWDWLIVTCGSKGVYVFNKKGVFNHYKVKQIKKPNVIGSGDIFFAGLISLYLRAYDIFSSSEIASFASTKLVSRPNERFLKKNDFKKDLVFTNGVFDILHKGHLGLLKFSRSLGNKLVVAINSDESVKKIKGKNRPLNNIKKRIDSLKKTKLVDEIIVFKEKTPIKIIKKIKPDVIVKGDDYKFKEVSGKKISNVILFPKLKNISTTRIIEKFKLI